MANVFSFARVMVIGVRSNLNWTEVGHCIFYRVRDKKILTSALTVDPLYLQHEHDGKSVRFYVILNVPIKIFSVILGCVPFSLD